jgi:hypothetical protein
LDSGLCGTSVLAKRYVYPFSHIDPSLSPLRIQLSYNYNFDSFTTLKRPPTHPEFVEAALQRRQRCLCGAPNCVGWLGKDPAESNKNSAEDNIAPELRASLTGAADGSATGPSTKKILLKVGASSSAGSGSRPRGIKRQAIAGAEIDSSRKRASAPANKGKGKARAPDSFSAEAAQAGEAAEYQHDIGLEDEAALHPDLAAQYLTEELHSAGDVPAPHHLAALLNPTGEEFVDQAYMAEQYPAAEMYQEAQGYQAGDMSYSEANPDEYAAEAEAQSSVAGSSERKTPSKGKGIRVIEKHRRKTKYGLIWKSDAELELERR